LPFDILDYGIQEAKIYGQVRATLERAGTPIGAYDLMIAAHCLCSRSTLITNNVKEFERVPGLILENWL